MKTEQLEHKIKLEQPESMLTPDLSLLEDGEITEEETVVAPVPSPIATQKPIISTSALSQPIPTKPRKLQSHLPPVRN
jgi:hypothetical protein